jgi:hypothetical protein
MPPSFEFMPENTTPTAASFEFMPEKHNRSPSLPTLNITAGIQCTATMLPKPQTYSINSTPSLLQHLPQHALLNFKSGKKTDCNPRAQCKWFLKKQHLPLNVVVAVFDDPLFNILKGSLSQSIAVLVIGTLVELFVRRTVGWLCEEGFFQRLQFSIQEGSCWLGSILYNTPQIAQ